MGWYWCYYSAEIGKLAAFKFDKSGNRLNQFFVLIRNFDEYLLKSLVDNMAYDSNHFFCCYANIREVQVNYEL